MIPIMKQNEDMDFMNRVFNRSQFNLSDVNKSVEAIIADVKNRGDEAIQEYTATFDHFILDTFKVPQKAIDEACDRIDPLIYQYLQTAKTNIENYHYLQTIESFQMKKPDGTIIEQRVKPIMCVGIYVPGGSASYPSTVLMNAIPAKIAGVPRIVMITPPSVDGIKDSVLVAAKIAGVDEIYTVGGAQGIAGLTYGTKQLPKVDKIVGPGNIYVAVAKRFVSGYVGIDMVAGPSEIAVLADEFANPEYIAADLLSQAEHDPLSAAILVTPSMIIAKKVQEAMIRQTKTLSRKQIIESSISNYGAIIVTNSLEEAVDVINKIAPEHLEIMTKHPYELVDSIQHAGAIFLGEHTPEPVGDYFAGPNHTLPTSGTARFQSALSTLDFIKKTSVVYYSESALQRDKDAIIGLCNEEGLTAHANAINVRF
jgi:histidinol dehydrogenase